MSSTIPSPRSGPRRAPLSPLGACARGLVVGALGTLAQDLFARATARIAPAPPPPMVETSEPEQRGEVPAETVARRVAQLAHRDLGIDKHRAGRLMHYAFGATWGGAYGLSAATYPALAGPIGGAAFGVVVWAASDTLLLPAFRLAASPGRYPPLAHAHAIAVHVAYGAALGLAFDAFTPRRGRMRETLVRASEPPAVTPRIPAPDLVDASAASELSAR